MSDAFLADTTVDYSLVQHLQCLVNCSYPALKDKRYSWRAVSLRYEHLVLVCAAHEKARFIINSRPTSWNKWTWNNVCLQNFSRKRMLEALIYMINW